MHRFSLDSERDRGNPDALRRIVLASFAMVALRILSLILLSGGLLTQPVLLQMTSCCCAQSESDVAVAADSDSAAPATGCPNCRAARQSSESPDTATSLRSCSCKRQVSPDAVVRIQSVTDVEMQFAAVDCPLDSSVSQKCSALACSQSHLRGKTIPVHIQKCSWLI